MAEAKSEVEKDNGSEVKNEVPIRSGTSIGGYTPRELEAIDSASIFAYWRMEAMMALLKFVRNMSTFELSEDRCKSFYSILNNTEYLEVIENGIIKHFKFYDYAEKALLKVRKCKGDTGQTLEVLYDKLERLYNDDTHQLDKDKGGTLADLHRKFVAEKDQLENMLRDIPGALSRMEPGRTQKKLDDILDKVDKLVNQTEHLRCVLEDVLRKLTPSEGERQ